MAALDDGASFDFVIVGAGAAGCVLANRLSENPALSVCVLEAGGPDSDYRIAMPAGAPELVARAGAHNWGFQSAPQHHLDGRTLFLASGRGWGGSSSIGDMIYLRGEERDYNDWDVPGWRFADLAPYFRRAAESSEAPMRVAPPQSKNEIFRAFVESAEEAGYKQVRDFGLVSREGAFYLPLTIFNGARWSAADAYLKPVTGIRANLAAISHAPATRVLIEAGRAIGVEYAAGLAGRLRKHVRARREVVLCAGALQTPKILMLSGIGDPEALSACGLAIAAVAPEVGRNLHDRPGVQLAFECPLPITFYAHTFGFKAFARAAEYRLARRGTGRFSYVEAGGFFKSHGVLAAADIEMQALAALPLDEARARGQQNGFTLSVALARPQSRGQVRLAGPDPSAPPSIDPNFLSSESERRALRDGLRMARDIAAKPGFAIYRGRELAPGPSVRTDGETDTWIARHAQSCYHAAGTSRLGADADAVLDPGLRVRGVDGLRVADASAFPALPTADPLASVIALAEKASDLILDRPAPRGV